MEKVQLKQQPDEDFLSILAAEQYAKSVKVKVSQWLILRAIASGVLKAERMKISGRERILIKLEEMDKWLESL